MLIRNATKEQIEKAAKSIKAIAVNQSKDARRFVLRPTKDCQFRRVSASPFRSGRKVNAVCWHGHRDFFRELFRIAPKAIVDTSLHGKTRYTAGSFEDVFEDSDGNIGPPISPIQHSECCSCPEGAF